MTTAGRGSEPAAARVPAGEGRESVAVLDQVLWRDLAAAESPEAFGSRG